MRRDEMKTLINKILLTSLITAGSLGIFEKAEGQDMYAIDSSKYEVNKDSIIVTYYFNCLDKVKGQRYDETPIDQATFMDKDKDGYYEKIGQGTFTNEYERAHPGGSVSASGISEERFNREYNMLKKDWTSPGEYVYDRDEKLIRKQIFK